MRSRNNPAPCCIYEVKTMEFMKMPCDEYVEILSTKAPVPGGGNASALVGAIGMSLGEMVGSLTLGRKKYQDVQEEIKEFMESANELRARMLRLAEEDSKVFEPLAKAYGMPKNTPSEIAEKEKVMEEALKGACQVPLKIMEACCEAIDLVKEFAYKGTSTAISDAGVGVIFTKAALQGAALNVFINTRLMKDRNLAEQLNSEADKMLKVYKPKADYVYAMVENRLR